MDYFYEDAQEEGQSQIKAILQQQKDTSEDKQRQAEHINITEWTTD